MGLRVKRNTPLVTRADVALGLVGLIVVLARQNETMPASPTTKPTEVRTTATPTRKADDGTSTGTTSEDASHMSTPKSSATAGGGTFSSSEAIATRVGHNVRHERQTQDGEAGLWLSARWRG